MRRWLVAFTTVMFLMLELSSAVEIVDGSKTITLNHKTIINENYHLHWTYDDEIIYVEMSANTLGWVGFGISPNGGMKGADMVIGWVDSTGEVFVLDTHGEGNFAPIVDDHSDVIKVSGSEKDGWTFVTFKRKLFTCDSQDIPITENTLKVVWAYGTEDPVDKKITNALYHGPSRRGSKSLIISSGRIGNLQNSVIDASTGYKEMTFAADKFSPPQQNTYYSCRTFQIPDLEKKHHAVKIEPVVQKGNEKYVHHMILYACGEPLTQFDYGEEHRCYDYENFQDAMTCRAIFHAWAVGGQSFEFPEKAGIPLGVDDSPKVVLLETHYDNPDAETFVDSSGLKIWYTDQLRQHDAGYFQIGHQVSDMHLIPPLTDSYKTPADCPKECLKYGMDSKGISEVNLFGIVQHSHLLGRAMELKHIRNGKELKPINVDKTYDFDYQELRMISTEIKLKAGDSLRQECTYNSSSRQTFTTGGQSTTDEMCLSFVAYYPKIPVESCMSRAQRPAFIDYLGLDSKQNGNTMVIIDGTKEIEISKYLINTLWSKEQIKGIENYELKTDRRNICYANYRYIRDIEYSSDQMEQIKSPYTEKAICPENGSTNLIFSNFLTFVGILIISFVLTF